MTIAPGVWICVAASLVASGVYGIALLRAKPGLLRALVKAAAIGALATGAALTSDHKLLQYLALALALSALGDFLLAFESRIALGAGIFAFLAAQLVYVLVFYSLRATGDAFEPAWARIAAIALMLGGSGYLLWRLWPSLGSMKYGVLPYIGAIAAMAAFVFLADWSAWPAMIGALLFLASDSVLSWELFKLPEGSPARVKTAPFVWWTYYFAQIGLAAGVVAAMQTI